MTWDLRGVFLCQGKDKQNRENGTKEGEGKKGWHGKGTVKRTCTDDLGLKGRFFFAKERTNRTGKMEQRKGKGKRAGTGKGP